MLTISDNFRDAIENYKVAPVTLVAMHFGGDYGDKFYTDAPRDLIVEGDTYSANNLLKRVSPPQSVAAVDRDTYRIEFGDIDGDIRDAIYSRPAGIPLTVKVALVDTNYTDGIKLLRTQDSDSDIELLTAYSGWSSSANSSISGNEVTTTVEFTGQIAKLDNNKARYTTKESQQEYDSTDTSMDYAHQLEGTLTLLWGRTED